MIDLISTDTMFPEYSTGMDTDEYLRETNNYLFLLRENLQWALRNIGISNFNPEQLNRIGSIITKPIMLTLGKDTDNIKSVLAINQEGVSETITGINNQFTTIGATVNGITAQISDPDTGLTALSAKAGKVEWLIANGDSATNFTLTDRLVSLMSQEIDLTGYVTFSSLTNPASQAFIDGGNIKADTLTADQIKFDNFVGKIGKVEVLEGEETGRDLSTISFGYGGLNAIASISSSFSIGTYDFNGGQITNRQYYMFDSSALYPVSDNAVDLGLITGSLRYVWKEIYAYVGPSSSSDRRLKKDIEYDLSRYDAVFDDVDPALFRFKNIENDSIHTGFIAQDFEEALLRHKIERCEFSALNIKGDTYTLRYTELIALLWRQVKLLKNRVEALEG